MATTYELIATTTLGSAAASYTFSSISSAYTDLVLIYQSTTAPAAAYVGLQFNSDTGTNYSVTRLSGSGTAASSDRKTSATKLELTAQSYIDDPITFNSIINVQNYANTTTYKTVISRQNLAAGGVDAVVGLWRSTSAISTIVLLTSSGTFDTGSTFTLYGILAA